MCGIAGIVNLNKRPVSSVFLKKMTDAIVHRGPDGEGSWIEGCVGLGHRRLSIVDLSADGRQPMISQDHRLILSYNGELYNFKELKTELEAEGYWFRSNTDTEVVLNAISCWGADAFLRFNGMFALAVWDRKDNSLFLARDRYGIKPLYLSQQGGLFLFASEIKGISAHPEFHQAVDKEIFPEYFTFQNIFTNKTFFENVKLLPAGTYLKITPDDTDILSKKPEVYWDYNFQSTHLTGSRLEYVEELDRLFNQAVNRQLMGDVEVGAYLSGGIDSGSITALSAKQLPNIKSFTCGFDLSSASGIELGFDERSKAEAMSALFLTEHYEIVLKAGDMERCLPKLVYHVEEPRVGQSYPNFYAAKLASKFVKVVLSGCGGDELFGGYPWRYYQAADCRNFTDYSSKYYKYWQRLTSNKVLHQLLSPISKSISDVSPKEIFDAALYPHNSKTLSPSECINHSLYLEAKTFLHGLFVVEDKISMSHSLETRVPFMDNDLVNFAMNCPIDLKLNNLNSIVSMDENIPGNKASNYFTKTNDGKQILRDMMSSYIPDSITGAVKQGFSSPDATWFKGESIDFVKKRLFNSKSPLFDYVDYDVCTQLVEQHLSGTENKRLMIWSLLYMNELLSTL